MNSRKFTAADIDDFRLGVDEGDNAAWDRFKLALGRVTGIPQPPKPRPSGWIAVSEPGW